MTRPAAALAARAWVAGAVSHAHESALHRAQLAAWALGHLGAPEPWRLLAECARIDPAGGVERAYCQILAWCQRRAVATREELLSAALSAAEADVDALAAALSRYHAGEERRREPLLLPRGQPVGDRDPVDPLDFDGEGKAGRGAT